MQENTNCFWEHHTLQQNIIVPICIIIHPRLDVLGIKDVQDIPKIVCNRIQAKNTHKEILFV